MVEKQIATCVALRRLEEKNRTLLLGSDSHFEPDSDFPLVVATAPAYWYTRHLKKGNRFNPSSSLEPVEVQEVVPHDRELSEEALVTENPEASRLIQEEQASHANLI